MPMACNMPIYFGLPRLMTPKAPEQTRINDDIYPPYQQIFQITQRKLKRAKPYPYGKKILFLLLI